MPTLTARELRRRYELCMDLHCSPRGSTKQRNAAHAQAMEIGYVISEQINSTAPQSPEDVGRLLDELETMGARVVISAGESRLTRPSR